MSFYYTKEKEVVQLSNDSETKTILVPGFYETYTEDMMFGTSMSMKLADPPLHPKTVHYLVEEYVNVNNIKSRFSEETDSIFKALNMNKQFNCLFDGKQGCGKTAIIYAIAQELHDTLNAIVFTVDCEEAFIWCTSWVKKAKKEYDFLSVIIFDECEDLFRQNENTIKPILDGNQAVPNNIYLFATNYIDRIPDTILKRPSRIHLSVTVDVIENEGLLSNILTGMNSELTEEVQLTVGEIEELVLTQKGYTIDEIKTGFINKVLDINLKRACGIKELIS